MLDLSLGRVPHSVYWDTTNSNLLVCETSKGTLEKSTRKIYQPSKKESKNKASLARLIVTLFSSQDHGLIVQDFFQPDPNLYSGMRQLSDNFFEKKKCLYIQLKHLLFNLYIKL